MRSQYPVILSARRTSRQNLIAGVLLSIVGALPVAGVESAYERYYPLPGQSPAFRYRDASTAAVSGGAIWFTEHDGRKVGKITTEGIITEYPAPPALNNPTSIALGPDGAGWFTSGDYMFSSGRIRRLAVDGTITEYPLPPNIYGNSISALAGSLWFGAHNTSTNTYYIGQITTAGTIRLMPMPIPVGAQRLVLGSDGAIWFVGRDAPVIGRMTLTGVFSFFYPSVLDTSLPYPLDITNGPDGALWFIGPGIAIGRIGLDGTITQIPIVLNTPPRSGLTLTGARPARLTSGPDGNLWFTERRNYIARCTLAGAVTEYQVTGFPDYPGFASDGGLWFVDLGLGTAPGRVGRLAVLTTPDVTPPVSHVLPLAPTQTNANFQVFWAGSDTGSGVKDFAIYVSDNGASYVPWITTDAQQGYYAGSAGHVYRFYSVARDLALNQEPAKGLAETTTQIPAVVPSDLNNDGLVNCADLDIVKTSFGKRVDQPGFDPRADLNHDGVVDIRDLAAVSQLLIPGTVCQ